MKIINIEESTSHTYDIEVPGIHEYLLGNGCVSHNTSGKSVNATEGTEPILDFFYKEEGTITIPTIAPNFRKNNRFYKKAFECNQFGLLRNAAIRQIYLDQAQSVNMYIARPDSMKEMTLMHMYYFDLGGKTLYYLKQQKETEEEICESCT